MKFHIDPRVGSRVGFLLAALPFLAACGGAGDALGVNKRPPDEFAVVTKAPLVMPPEYRLRPPDAANPRPEETDSQTMAIEALFPGRSELPPLPSEGEEALLRSAGALSARSDIRSSLTDDEEMIVGKGELTVDILNSEVVEDEVSRTVRLEPQAVTR